MNQVTLEVIIVNKVFLAILIALSLGNCTVYSMECNDYECDMESEVSESSAAESSGDEDESLGSTLLVDLRNELTRLLPSANGTPDSDSRDAFGQESELINAVLENDIKKVEAESLKLFKEKRFSLIQRDPIQEIQHCIQISSQHKSDEIKKILEGAREWFTALKTGEEILNALNRIQEQEDKKRNKTLTKQLHLKSVITARNQKKV